MGSTTTDYLDALNWGTGTAETTLTLGTDRLDVRIPGDQYHSSHLQLARHNQLLLTMSQYFKGGSRAQLIPQSSNPFGATESGVYVDTSGTLWVVYNGTRAALSITSQATAATFNGAQSLDGINPYVDITWPVAWTSAAAYRITGLTPIITSSAGLITANVKNKTASGCRVLVSDQFTGTVELVSLPA